MAFQEKGVSEEVKSIIDIVKTKTVITGEYLGSKTFDGKKVGEINTLHMFRANGEIIGCWGSTDLNSKLRGEEHKNVRVSFKEKRDIGGGRTFKVFIVEVDNS
jgi:hypothetical protein